MENSPTENQIHSTCHPMPIWNADQYQTYIPNFKIGQERLAELVEANGIHEITAALETNVDAGISGDALDLHRRRIAFGSNQYFEDQPSFVAKGLYQLMLEAFKDTTVILLLCCAALSLVIGIKRNGLQEGFLDGFIISLAVFIVVNFGVVFRFFKARRMRKLSRDIKKIGITRNGRTQQRAVSEVVVGDILSLKAGDRVPADGLFIDGDSFKLDDDLGHDGSDYYNQRSIFTGAKVVGGHCSMLVTSVGNNTEKSKLMRSLSGRNQIQVSKLKISIDKMNTCLEKICLSLSLLVLIVQLLRCFLWRSWCDENHNPDPKGVKNTMGEIMNEATKLMKKQSAKVNGLVAILCVLLFSIKDGLPLGIFVSLKYAAKKMMLYQAMVKELPASAKIGLVTKICTGKTSDLILQHSKMAELWIGLDSIKDFPIREVHEEVLGNFCEGVGMNVSGSGSVENPLPFWAERVLGINMEELHQNRTIIHTEAFDLKENRSGLSLRRNGEVKKVVHVHWKGAPDKVLSMCSHYYDVGGTIHTLDEQKRAEFNNVIQGFPTDTLQCFAFAYKQVVKQEKEEEEEEEEEDAEEEAVKPTENGLTLLGMVRLKNPYAPELRQATKQCQESGVGIKLVVGDDVNTARFMGINSGILRQEEDTNGRVIEASEFRHSSEEDRMKMADRISVMANSSPSDKLLLLQCLKQRGEVVAVTGISTRDSPALKEADVGLSVGDNAAELAKESDIIILDRNFVTISSILNLGSCVCNNLQKFVQLQQTLNIVAFTINFIIILSSGSEEPIGAFQLLWVNLIMDIFGALALAEPQSSQIRTETSPPIPRAAQHITRNVWRNIAVQSLYQVIVLLTLYFMGKYFLHTNDRVIKAIIFNCYVLCQVSVLINARIENTSVFEGMLKHKNCGFLVGAIVILQVATMEIMAVCFHTERLNLKQWSICIGIAALSLPLGWVTNNGFSFTTHS